MWVKQNNNLLLSSRHVIVFFLMCITTCLCAFAAMKGNWWPQWPPRRALQTWWRCVQRPTHSRMSLMTRRLWRSKKDCFRGKYTPTLTENAVSFFSARNSLWKLLKLSFYLVGSGDFTECDFVMSPLISHIMQNSSLAIKCISMLSENISEHRHRFESHPFLMSQRACILQAGVGYTLWDHFISYANLKETTVHNFGNKPKCSYF